MDKDVIEADRGLVYGGYGEYLLNGIFVAYGTNLEACSPNYLLPSKPITVHIGQELTCILMTQVIIKKINSAVCGLDKEGK